MLATDHSVWSLPPADTLTFVIASVADLADATLARRFDIAGDSVNHLTPEREVCPGLEALSIVNIRELWVSWRNIRTTIQLLP